MCAHVRVEADGPVTVIHLDKPQRRNARRADGGRPARRLHGVRVRGLPARRHPDRGPWYAVAGSLELALLADLRVVEEDAIFGVFCRRWGVPLIDGGTVRLPRIVGLGRALDLILTGRPVDLPVSEALRAEGAAGVSVVAAEGLAGGAARFAAGAGRLRTGFVTL